MNAILDDAKQVVRPNINITIKRGDGVNIKITLMPSPEIMPSLL